MRSGLSLEALSEVHGNMYMELCKMCVPNHCYLRLFDVTERTALRLHKTGRYCKLCATPLRDTIVHFGEKGGLTSPYNWQEAADAVAQASLILCLGTSLKVLKRYPCLWAMNVSVRERPDLYIANLQWTPKDEQAVLKLNGRCDVIMRYVMEQLGIEVPKYSKLYDPIFKLATPLRKSELKTTTRNILEKPEGFQKAKRSQDKRKATQNNCKRGCSKKKRGRPAKVKKKFIVESIVKVDMKEEIQDEIQVDTDNDSVLTECDYMNVMSTDSYQSHASSVKVDETSQSLSSPVDTEGLSQSHSPSVEIEETTKSKCSILLMEMEEKRPSSINVEDSSQSKKSCSHSAMSRVHGLLPWIAEGEADILRGLQNDHTYTQLLKHGPAPINDGTTNMCKIYASLKTTSIPTNNFAGSMPSSHQMTNSVQHVSPLCTSSVAVPSTHQSDSLHQVLSSFVVPSHSIPSLSDTQCVLTTPSTIAYHIPTNTQFNSPTSLVDTLSNINSTSVGSIAQPVISPSHLITSPRSVTSKPSDVLPLSKNLNNAVPCMVMSVDKDGNVVKRIIMHQNPYTISTPPSVIPTVNGLTRHAAYPLVSVPKSIDPVGSDLPSVTALTTPQVPMACISTRDLIDNNITTNNKLIHNNHSSNNNLFSHTVDRKTQNVVSQSHGLLNDHIETHTNNCIQASDVSQASVTTTRHISIIPTIQCAPSSMYHASTLNPLTYLHHTTLVNQIRAALQGGNQTRSSSGPQVMPVHGTQVVAFPKTQYVPPHGVVTSPSRMLSVLPPPGISNSIQSTVHFIPQTTSQMFVVPSLPLNSSAQPLLYMDMLSTTQSNRSTVHLPYQSNLGISDELQCHNSVTTIANQINDNVENITSVNPTLSNNISSESIVVNDIVSHVTSTLTNKIRESMISVLANENIDTCKQSILTPEPSPSSTSSYKDCPNNNHLLNLVPSTDHISTDDEFDKILPNSLNNHIKSDSSTSTLDAAVIIKTKCKTSVSSLRNNSPIDNLKVVKSIPGWFGKGLAQRRYPGLKKRRKRSRLQSSLVKDSHGTETDSM